MKVCVSIPGYDSYSRRLLTQSYVGKIDNTNGTLALSTTEFNFFTIKPLTDSRGKTGTFDSSITNVWCRGRELQIKNGLAKRLKKKKAKNVNRTVKDDDLKLERQKLLRLVSNNC